MPAPPVTEPHHLPTYHFTPPCGWMNDPNGLIYYETEWHLFYQYLPPGAMDKHWGHAVSDDLLIWQHLPIALFPDELGAIWSGSCVADTNNTSGLFDGKGGLVAIFTHHLDGQAAPQSQSLAYSSDQGRTWIKYEGNPVLRSENSDFRDPKVFWHSPSASWVMILAAGGQVEIYRSAHLKEWTFASAFGKGRSELVWECPDLFPLPDGTGGEVWILTSSFLSGDNFKGKVAPCQVSYFAGDFDGFFFNSKTECRRLSHGPDDYAAVTFTDAPERKRILLGWLNHWGYSSYSGQMTLPRELHWRDGALVQTPVPVFKKASRCQRVEIKTGDGMLSPMEVAVAPWQLVMAPGSPVRGIEVSKGGALIFSLDREEERGIWSFRRGLASFPSGWKNQKADLESIFTAVHEAPHDPEKGEATLVIVDTFSVEIFCDGGSSYLAAQIFPPEGKWEIRPIDFGA